MQYLYYNHRFLRFRGHFLLFSEAASGGSGGKLNQNTIDRQTKPTDREIDRPTEGQTVRLIFNFRNQPPKLNCWETLQIQRNNLRDCPRGGFRRAETEKPSNPSFRGRKWENTISNSFEQIENKIRRPERYADRWHVVCKSARLPLRT